MTKTNFLMGAAIATLVLGAPAAIAQKSLPALISSAEAQESAPQSAPQSSVTRTTTTTEQVSVQTFHEKLQPLGDFVKVDVLGEVWKPRDVPSDWQPYSVGRWIFNREVGWYFESNEPWAEITYHYGRWYDDPDQGWVWVPGTEWAPAWVEWRRSDRYVGWRPLPPDNAPKRVTRRTTTTTVTRTGAPEETEVWVFVPADRVVSEEIETVRVRREQVTEVYQETKVVGSVERRQGYAVNFALEPQAIERSTSVRITSQNLPQPKMAPVPSQIRQIATEQRTAPAEPGQTGTVQPDRQAPSGTAGQQRPAAQPGEQPSGTATAPSPAPAPGRADAKQQEELRTRQGTAPQPGTSPGTGTGTTQKAPALQQPSATRAPAQQAPTAERPPEGKQPAARSTGREQPLPEGKADRTPPAGEPAQRGAAKPKGEETTGATTPSRDTPELRPQGEGQKRGERTGEQPLKPEPGQPPRAERQGGSQETTGSVERRRQQPGGSEAQDKQRGGQSGKSGGGAPRELPPEGQQQ